MYLVTQRIQEASKKICTLKEAGTHIETPNIFSVVMNKFFPKLVASITIFINSKLHILSFSKIGIG